MSSLSGCIVAEPPSYDDPEPSPPILDLSQAVPLIRVPFIVNQDGDAPTRGISVSVPVRSNDQGDKLRTALHFDHQILTLNRSYRADGEVRASVFDDLSRSVELSWDFGSERLSAGCHTLTLLVAHARNWRAVAPDLINGRNDTAIAVWFLNVDPPESDPYTLVNCPVKSEVTP